jgi:hypothetical protein
MIGAATGLDQDRANGLNSGATVLGRTAQQAKDSSYFARASSRTTLCATFLGWSLRSGHSYLFLSSAFVATFILLCLLHALLFAASLRLPLSIDKTTEISAAGDEPKTFAMAE